MPITVEELSSKLKDELKVIHLVSDTTFVLLVDKYAKMRRTAVIVISFRGL